MTSHKLLAYCVSILIRVHLRNIKLSETGNIIPALEMLNSVICFSNPPAPHSSYVVLVCIKFGNRTQDQYLTFMILWDRWHHVHFSKSCRDYFQFLGFQQLIQSNVMQQSYRKPREGFCCAGTDYGSGLALQVLFCWVRTWLALKTKQTNKQMLTY